MPTLIEHHADLIFQAGERAVKTVQHLPQAFLDSLRADRNASSAPATESYRVASIPNALVEKWQREGFDVFRESARDIVARLKAEGYDHFLTTDKAV